MQANMNDNMKTIKKSIVVAFMALVCSLAFADAFTDAVQDLGVYAACVGTYSASEAGGGWYDDPHDYYRPQDVAARLANESGDKTKTNTFYGICFNYAEAAYEYVNRYVTWYQSRGMYERQFWIAGVQQNPNQLELMSLGDKNNYSRIQNGVPVKTYSTSLRDVKTHGGATYHAWIWIEREDGIWFWIDPTWTDNLGYVVYGYVNNGVEIQCRPDKGYCQVYPSSLDSLPLPPAMGPKKAPSKTANSTNRSETINDAATDLIVRAILEPVDKGLRDTFINVDYSLMDSYWGLIFSTDFPFSAISDGGIKPNKMGYGLDLFYFVENGAVITGLEYLINRQNENNMHSLILDIDFTRRFTGNIAWYLGGGVGLRFDFSNDTWLPREQEGLVGHSWFAWEVETGLVLNFYNFFSKLGVSYNNVIGFSASVGVGLAIESY